MAKIERRTSMTWRQWAIGGESTQRGVKFHVVFGPQESETI